MLNQKFSFVTVPMGLCLTLGLAACGSAPEAAVSAPNVTATAASSATPASPSPDRASAAAVTSNVSNTLDVDAFLADPNTQAYMEAAKGSSKCAGVAASITSLAGALSTALTSAKTPSGTGGSTGACPVGTVFLQTAPQFAKLALNLATCVASMSGGACGGKTLPPVYGNKSADATTTGDCHTVVVLGKTFSDCP